jgi:hypothetical protein
MGQSNQAFISLMKSLESQQEEHSVVCYEPKAKPKDEGLIWQEYNDHPAPLVPSVDKALISDTVSPISLNEAFDSVMAVHHFYRMVAALAGVATIAIIVAIPLVLVWILR